jgi:hypothetical protein
LPPIAHGQLLRPPPIRPHKNTNNTKEIRYIIYPGPRLHDLPLVLGGEVGGPASHSRVTTSDVVVVVVFALFVCSFFVGGVCSLSCSSSFSVGPWGLVSGARSVYRLGFWQSFDPIYTSLHTHHRSTTTSHPSVSSFVRRLLSTGYEPLRFTLSCLFIGSLLLRFS